MVFGSGTLTFPLAYSHVKNCEISGFLQKVNTAHPIVVTGSSAINLMGLKFQFLYLIIGNIFLLSSNRALLYHVLDVTCTHQSSSFRSDPIT